MYKVIGGKAIIPASLAASMAMWSMGLVFLGWIATNT